MCQCNADQNTIVLMQLHMWKHGRPMWSVLSSKIKDLIVHTKKDIIWLRKRTLFEKRSQLESSYKRFKHKKLKVAKPKWSYIWIAEETQFLKHNIQTWRFWVHCHFLDKISPIETINKKNQLYCVLCVFSWNLQWYSSDIWKIARCVTKIGFVS